MLYAADHVLQAFDQDITLEPSDWMTLLAGSEVVLVDEEVEADLETLKKADWEVIHTFQGS